MPNDNQLFVEVVGGGAKGETIILGLPNGTWGIVDCYSGILAGAVGSNATVKRLRELKIQTLEFVALTHPHDDHYRGMSRVLTAFPPKRFWQFGGLSALLLQYLQAQADADDPRAVKTSVDDLMATYRIVGSGAAQKTISFEYLTGVTLLLDTTVQAGNSDVRLTVHSIAPNGTVVRAYEEELVKCFDGDRVDSKKLNLDHNQLSAAFIISFGETRLVLGGDVTEATWKPVLSNLHELGMPVHASYVKVSHHGSANGYCDNLWSELSKRRKPSAVVTPYKRQLPELPALAHISEHAGEILVTRYTPPTQGHTPVSAAPPSNSTIQVAERLRTDAVATVPRRLLPGRCTMTFDHLGNILTRELAGEACCVFRRN
ncbi:MAG: hypothetical protein ACLQVD_11455 [Capsulimonadaceae bacterium]